MKKQAYMKPAMRVVKIQHHKQILAGSIKGMNEELQDDVVTEGW